MRKHAVIHRRKALACSTPTVARRLAIGVSSRQPRSRALLGQLIAVLVATLASSFVAATVPDALPAGTPTITVKDSGIAIYDNQRLFWVDNESVLFPGITEETYERSYGVRVPVMQIMLWNTTTGEVRQLDKYYNYGGFCYYDGRFIFRKFVLEEGRRQSDGGTAFSTAWYGGTLNGWSRLDLSADQAKELGDASKDTCQPRSELPPFPEWIGPPTGRPSVTRLRPEFGFLVHSWRGEPLTSTPLPLVCPYASAGPKACKSLGIPALRSSRAMYVAHLDRYAIWIYGGKAGERLPGVYLARDGTTTPFSIGQQKDEGGPGNPLFTRIGLLNINRDIRSPYELWGAGLYLWRDGRPVRLLGGYIDQSFSGQTDVSPDGCKLALRVNKRSSRELRTVHLIRLCSGE